MMEDDGLSMRSTATELVTPKQELKTGETDELNPPKRRQLCVLSIGDKYKIVEQLIAGVKQSKISHQLNISRSVVSRIWLKRVDIENQFLRGRIGNKRHRKPNFEAVDKALLRWVRSMLEKNETLTPNICMNQANQFAHELGVEWKCSPGWFQRFRLRHGVMLKQSDSQREHQSQLGNDLSFHEYLASENFEVGVSHEIQDPIVDVSVSQSLNSYTEDEQPVPAQMLNWLKHIEFYLRDKVTCEADRTEGLKNISALTKLINQPKITNYFERLY